ncbi:MAG: cobalamin-binding protein [Pseudomonadota bacterium]
MRVVTLLPSATEIVCGLGLQDQLVGVSHSCNFPAAINQLPTVTSTHVPFTASSETIDNYVREHLSGHEALYDLDVAALESLQPDVIVSQALCDVCAVATGDVTAALTELSSKPTLIDLTPNTLDDVFDDIRRVGETLDLPDRATALVADLKARCERLASTRIDRRPRVAFLEWLIPPFNGGHWNPELVRLAGGVDLLGAHGQPSSSQDWEQIADADPDLIFIACCGFRVERALEDVEQLQDHPVWQSLRAVRDGRVFVTDGNAYFASPGPRLIDGLEVLAHALHPTIHPRPDAAPLVRIT